VRGVGIDRALFRLLGSRLLSRPVPWEQLVDATGRVIGNAAEHEGGTLATAIGAGEQPGLSAESQAA